MFVDTKKMLEGLKLRLMAKGLGMVMCVEKRDRMRNCSLWFENRLCGWPECVCWRRNFNSKFAFVQFLYFKMRLKSP